MAVLGLSFWGNTPPDANNWAMPHGPVVCIWGRVGHAPEIFFAHNLPCNDNNSHRGLWEQPPQLSEFCQFLNDETIAVQHLKFTTHVYTKNYRLVYSLLKILATPLEYLLMYRLAPKTETIFECSHL